MASYEGGGYSENKKNRNRDRIEHEIITSEYMSKYNLLKYKIVMVLTLAPVRRFIAETSFLSGIYQWVKRFLYGKK